jgi:protein-L-isoaspartate(D-aspartate) O-methyltransferase
LTARRINPDIMITVFFRNGQRAELPNATRVEAESFPVGPSGDLPTSGIACYDGDNNVVGRFLVGEIVGYAIAEARAGERPAPTDRPSDAAALHRALIDGLKSAGQIRTPPVEAAFRAIPRHLFLPGLALDRVYRDDAIPTKLLYNRAVSSSSQPAIMAIMLEQLGLEPGHRVLEIGAGTGYNAALMAHIVGETGRVTTVDIDEELVERARGHLAAAGFGGVQVVRGDGGLGYAEGAPYDRIILTVGSWDVVPAWREQLRPGGRLVLPLSIRGPERSVAFEHAEGYLTSVSVEPCGFMPLRGAFAGPRGRVQLGPDPSLYLVAEDPERVDAEATYELLTGPRRDWPTAVRITPPLEGRGLGLWLAAREPDIGQLVAEGSLVDGGIVPCLWRVSRPSYRVCSTAVLLGQSGLCALTGPPDQPPAGGPDGSESFELFVRSFGPDEGLAQQLVQQVAAWDAAGRPSTEGLRIRAYPSEVEYHPSANEAVVQKRWTRLVLDWP